VASGARGLAEFTPASSSEGPQITELRKVLVNAQFQVFRWNLALTTNHLHRWHEQDSGTLSTATVELTDHIRGTASGAAESVSE